MTLKDIQKKLNNLILVDKNILKKFEPRKEALNYNIKYWLKNGDLIALKKGVYIFKNRYLLYRDKDTLLEYMANQFVQPSYISLEYVLAKYQLLTEAVNTITSISTKTTREYKNNLGNFRYYTVSQKLFCGYELRLINELSVYTATKAKALFDFLYLRFLKNASIGEKEIQELRINWENVNKKDYSELMIYAGLSRSQNAKEVIKLIKKYI